MNVATASPELMLKRHFTHYFEVQSCILFLCFTSRYFATSNIERPRKQRSTQVTGENDARINDVHLSGTRDMDMAAKAPHALPIIDGMDPDS